MIIYDSEIQDKLSDILTANDKVVMASTATETSPIKMPSIDLEDSEVLDPGLSQVYSILVTTNWNRNDDVFTPSEVIKAINTPVWKPANEEHEANEEVNKIIGVINSSTPVNDDYEPISINVDSPPAKFHVLISTLLWEKYFPKVVAKIKKNIDENKQFVSMECIFPDFGYAIKAKDSNEVSLLDRTKDTAYLTKYLRSYGGKGLFKDKNEQEYRIGRWLKNFTFSGVGYVKKPANPESVTFTNYSSSQAKEEETKFNKIEKFECLPKFGVFNSRGTQALWLN